MEHKGCGGLTVRALDDALSLESGEFCDSGMECLGVELHYLAPFLCAVTQFKLACTDVYAALRLRTGTVKRNTLAAVLLRISLEHVSAIYRFRELVGWMKCGNRRLDGPSFRFFVHALVGVFQKGLKLHERSPRPSLSYNRVRRRYAGIWVCKPESCLEPYEVTSLPEYVELTWHPSCRKVGILMVTRRLYVRRSRKKKSNIPDSEMQHLPESLPDGIDYLVIT